MKKVITLLAITVLSFTMFTGCASIMKGGKQKISISSVPDSAEIKILDKSGAVVDSGNSPYVADLNRGSGMFQAAEYKVVVTKKGYDTQEFKIKGDLDNGWYLFGNFFIGGLIGWVVVDPASGAMWNLSPEKVSADLKEKLALNGKDKELVVILSEKVPQELLTEKNKLN